MSHPANLLGALKESYLTKSGGSHKSWKTRWFVLTKDVLYYFENELSTQPKGVIQLKDYSKCKGMEGNAFQVTRKQNSFFLEMPYRTFKMFATEWRTSEEWAESISAIGDLLQKKEDMRKPSPYQNTMLTSAYDLVTHGSSLIHYFKLIVDSTPAYKKGIRSIYNSAIYDIPRDLGRQVTVAARDALNCISHPRNTTNYQKLVEQLSKLTAIVDKCAGFIVCCVESHKSSFNSDLDVIRRSIANILALTPAATPADEVVRPAEALYNACTQMCQPFLARSGPNLPSGKPTVTAATIGQLQRQLAAAVESNLFALKGKAALAQEAATVKHMQTSLEECKQATTGLAQLCEKSDPAAPTEGARMQALCDEVATHCQEIVNGAQKVFVEANYL